MPGGGESATRQVVGVQRPAEIVNYGTIGVTPALMATALAAAAIVALGLTLTASVRDGGASWPCSSHSASPSGSWPRRWPGRPRSPRPSASSSACPSASPWAARCGPCSPARSSPSPTHRAGAVGGAGGRGHPGPGQPGGRRARRDGGAHTHGPAAPGGVTGPSPTGIHQIEHLFATVSPWPSPSRGRSTISGRPSTRSPSWCSTSRPPGGHRPGAR